MLTLIEECEVEEDAEDEVERDEELRMLVDRLVGDDDDIGNDKSPLSSTHTHSIQPISHKKLQARVISAFRRQKAKT